MELESQVCTPQQAEKFKDLGIRGKSLFYHTIDFKNGYVPNAFTVAELGIMLPIEIKGKQKGLTLSKYRRNDGLWFVYYSYTLKNESYGENELLMENSITGYNEAITVADMLIYLLENKLVSAEACNSRLVE